VDANPARVGLVKSVTIMVFGSHALKIHSAIGCGEVVLGWKSIWN